MVLQFKEKINNFYFVPSPIFTLVSVALCKFLYGFSISAIGSLLVPIGETFNINIKAQSAVFPFNYFGQIVIIFFIGYFADKMGKKILQIGSLILFSLSALLFNYINNFYLFLFMFFLVGLFGMSINTIADATISDIFSKKRGYYLNMAHVIGGMGAVTAPVLFNLSFSRTNDFRSLYFILFLISIFIMIMISVAHDPSVEIERVRPGIIIEILKNRPFIYLCLFGLFSSGALLSVSGWIPTIFQKNLNISSEISNYSLAIFWFAIVAGRMVTGILSRRFKETTLLKTACIAIFFVLSASFFFSDYLFLLIDYLLFGFLIGGTFPLLVAFSAEVYPKYSTTRLAILFSFTAAGMLLIPLVVGILGDYFMINRIISFNSIIFLVYFVIFAKKINTF